MPAAHILVIECTPAIQELIALNLGMAGHRVSRAADAESAMLMLEDSLPDMVLLDWNLPGQSGLSLVRRLRAQSRTRTLPIMMVTARCGEPDKIMALEAGADDYMTKPFSPREMVARVHCLLRRWQSVMAAEAPVQLAGLRLDPCTQRVTAGARELALGRVEFKLLNYLMSHPERVHTRAQLLDQVWGSAAYLDERTVDTHVGRLRSALQPSGYQQRIETVRGSGYRFVAAQA
ncbi:two-component system, OmpR family, phosphate regulon response regulator PhoB [Duganella sp. CF402]|uniref:winged helix-turn-helix domain-containing protein n=1 Tax=unclassified Duganella TaxID=2636909 RepID=UPI0008C37602|nr:MULTISPECIES: winged helix-turn-helix domain-containing protein [unclassified Duganella]RZT01898.1 two-component system phosphate regulon response regulator PhoB [Duganella sp. BK701]SEN19347.1 two-component system, OmpR family, phosphate regulon response regulator PhoB [Duganella sp. CF402]